MYHKGVCEYLMMKGLTILVITYVYGAFAAASVDNGMYCTGSDKNTWRNSMKQCKTKGGTSLSHNFSLGNVLNTHIFIDGNASVWTADYLVRNESYGEELCGFIYKYKSTDKGQTFFGSCDKNRFYICRNSSHFKWQVYEGHYKNAIDQKCGVVDDSVLRNITDIFKSGTYWMKNSLLFEREIFEGQYTDVTLCGAFSKDAGPFFRNCTDKIQTLCHFVDPPPSGLYGECFDGNQTKSSRKEEEKDIGTTIGLSVGLCLALICGIICAIYIARRYRCWKTINSNNNNSKTEYQSNMSPSGQAITHANPSYDATPNVNQTVEYSLVNKTGNKVRYAGEQTYATEQDYDVSGNVQRPSSNTSNNVYNTFQGEAYNTTNNVDRKVLPDNVYDRAQSEDTNSVYDSSVQTIDLTKCDSVYNHLSENSTKDDQTYYASTVTPNTNKLGTATDQTYDKLK